MVFFQEKYGGWVQLQKGWVITIILFFSNFMIDLRQSHATALGAIIHAQ